MSTGPGPTRKPDGTADASVDDIADLLVEDEPSVHPAEEVSSPGVSADESLDVMLETPGPAVANPFMPPPPSPMGDVGDSADENETADDGGAATNLAYEDLLAKLVLPAKAPEPEPEMPAVMSSLPLPELAPLPTPILSPPPLFPGPDAPSLQIAPPAEERTLVTENPLVAEEQEAAVREGRLALRPEPPVVVHEQLRGLVTEPVVATNGMAKSRLFYLMLGGLLVLGGMILAVLLLKLLMPTPAPQPPAIIAPTPPPPPPPSAPPAHVEPLPPSAPPAAAVPGELPAAAPENPSAIPETVPSVEPERRQPRPRPSVRPRPSRPVAPKAATAPKAAPVPKAAVPKAPKAAPAKKPSKLSGYADPFDN